MVGAPDLYLGAPGLKSPMLSGSPSHHGVVCPQVADGEDSLQIWRVAANVLNKHLWVDGMVLQLGGWAGANNLPL
jgi:hypothetical protein